MIVRGSMAFDMGLLLLVVLLLAARCLGGTGQSGGGTIQPFQLRARGTAAHRTHAGGPHDDLQPMHPPHAPSPRTFSWGCRQTGHLLALTSAEGEWTNWTEFNGEDLKTAAAADKRTGNLPHLILSLDAVWDVGASTVPLPFATAIVEVEFAPAASGPTVATTKVSATLGFAAGGKSCKAQCASLGLLISKAAGPISVLTFRDFNNATYYGMMAASYLPPSARPRLFPLIDRLITDSDLDNERLGLAALAGLGYTGMGSSHAHGPHTKSEYGKVGLQWTSTGMRETDCVPSYPLTYYCRSLRLSPAVQTSRSSASNTPKLATCQQTRLHWSATGCCRRDLPRQITRT